MTAITQAVDQGDRRARANVLRLAVAQALAGANASVIFATGAIIGSTLAPDPAWATVPISVFVVGMAAGTLPTGWLARRYGRRAAFMAGGGAGVLAGLVAAGALLAQSFPLYCLATLFAGLYASVVQSFRFAAADGASTAFRPKALSWVMAGGVFAGVIGPQLVTWTMDLWSPNLFVVSYLAQAGVALLAMGVLAVVNAAGDVIDRDGSILAGVRGPDGFVGAAALLRAMAVPLLALAGSRSIVIGDPSLDDETIHAVAQHGLSGATPYHDLPEDEQGALIDSLRIEPDLTRRRAMVTTVLRLVAEELPMVPLYRRTITYAMSKKMQLVQWPSDAPELRWLRVK